jgi:hypothetical protein
LVIAWFSWSAGFAGRRLAAIIEQEIRVVAGSEFAAIVHESDGLPNVISYFGRTARKTVSAIC